MANICSYSMIVKGEMENIKKFVNAMEQKGDIWMGRGAEADVDWEWDENTVVINGWVKWSIYASLCSDAVSMEKQRVTGEGMWYWNDGIQNVKEFLTLWQACQRFNVNMEVYSEEPGCEFQEHYKYENGNITEESVEYKEIYFEDYEDEGYSREGIENLLGIEITDDEWDDGYKEIGGFKDWDFELEDVIAA